MNHPIRPTTIPTPPLDLHRQHGFSLVEMIVVGVIIGILAAIAIPLYTGYITDQKISSAKASCQLIGAAVVQAHSRGTSITANDHASLGISSPNDEYWQFSFPALSAAATLDENYTITATGISGSLSGASVYYYPCADSKWSLP